ncbi:hypothetical protein [Capnocytophaga leadbetteri]|uniref:hypothetical protein n=1 Tax=Capnocytophaga leadbetteri TaxID=327575 RepID=UPI0028D8D07A|nr:hypothetical protein [Capnocytophaga leadbetteri]
MQEPSPNHKYFKSLLPEGTAYYTQPRELGGGLQVVDLSRIPHNIINLYLAGFPYYALQEEAAELLQALSSDTLLKLIEKKKTQYPPDVPILERALALKEAAKNNSPKPVKSD